MTAHGSTDDVLARVALFRDLSTRQRRRIAGLMTRLDEPAGTVLTREGTLGAEFVILLEGAVEVRRGRREFTTLLADNPELSKLLLTTMAERLAELDGGL